jgi:hypothetical protein
VVAEAKDLKPFKVNDFRCTQAPAGVRFADLSEAVRLPVEV